MAGVELSGSMMAAATASASAARAKIAVLAVSLINVMEPVARATPTMGPARSGSKTPSRGRPGGRPQAEAWLKPAPHPELHFDQPLAGYAGALAAEAPDRHKHKQHKRRNRR